nr:uncharacterized protein LOC109165392 [Ipomoea batatas]GMD11130.1 uncharacterized protein LOC109165392 [Ipomoea batatas]
MSEREAPRRLLKHKTWSPNMYREETWVRRQAGNDNRPRRRDRCKNVTDDDLDELRGCIDLGFGFHPEPNDLDPKLAETFPALELFCAVNKQYNESLSRSSSMSNMALSDNDTTTTTPLAGSPAPSSMFDLGNANRQFFFLVVTALSHIGPFSVWELKAKIQRQ